MAQEIGIVNGNQIFTALNSITREAMEKKKGRGLDFRFLSKDDIKTTEETKKAFDKVEEIEKKLEGEFGISVEFYENIDIKNTAEGHKFYFRIYDENNCFAEVDALEYRKIVLDPSKSETDYIVEKLFKVIGLKVQGKVLEISELITELISYVYYFDELQYKLYENIGWDVYNKELIFKYDRIYNKTEEEIRSACISDIAGKFVNEYSEEIKVNWRDKFAKLMNSSTVARIVISAACTGLVRSIMPYNKETNINMNIVGEPGSGKSSLSQFALSIFGDPQALEGSFIDKDNAMEIIRVKRPVIPYILDDRLLKIDTLSDKAKGRELLFDVFREYEGKVTERVGGAYKELSGRRTNAPIISSSVESMIQILKESGKDLGQYRRFIELELKRSEIFGGDSRIVNEYHDLSYQNYGIGVQYIVNYILDVGVKFVNKLYSSIFDDITEKLDRKSTEVKISGLSSSASRFALIATTYVIIREAINTVDFESEEGISFEGLELVGSAGSEADCTGVKQSLLVWNSYQQQQQIPDDEAIKLLLEKRDDCYTELINYLIDNLLQKMENVNVVVNVEENIKAFLNEESNMKWFITTHKTDFFDNYSATHIGFMQKNEDDIKIVFTGNKCIEWLFCSGKKFSDEQIKKYLQSVHKNRAYKTIAEKFFGKEIVNKDIKKEISKIPCLTYSDEAESKHQKNAVSITVSFSKEG